MKLYKGVRIAEEKSVKYIVKSPDGKTMYRAASLRAARVWVDGYLAALKRSGAGPQ